jgi:hypothetical protein
MAFSCSKYGASDDQAVQYLYSLKRVLTMSGQDIVFELLWYVWITESLSPVW